MNLISQYLYKNCTKASIAVFVVLLFILLANTGLRLVEDVNEGDIPSIFLIELLALKVVQYSSIIIPLSLFFGIIITLNRLYVTNEMTIIKLNGFSNYHLARILSILIMLVTIFMIILKFFLAPLAVEHRSKIEHQISHEQKIYSLKEGSFNISNDKSKVVYINNKEKSELANIFIRSLSKSGTRIDISSGVTSNDIDSNLISLNNGISYVFNPDGSFSSTEYSTQDMILANEIPEFSSTDVESKSFFELVNMTDLLSAKEIFNRVSIIIAGLILAYLAIPLSNYAKKNDKYRNIFIGALIYFSYIIIIQLASSSVSSKFDLAMIAFFLHTSYIYFTFALYKHTTTAVN